MCKANKNRLSAAKTYSVKRGSHDFKPTDSFYLVAPWGKEVNFKVKFSDNCAYYLSDGDQKDWNKGGGFSFSLFSNLKNSVMWAWRYAPEIRKMELSAYWHEKGKAHYAETENFEPVIVDFNEEIEVRIYKPGVHWFVDFTRKNGSLYSVNTEMKGWPIRPIGLYFGGNKPAPKDMEVSILRY